MSIVIFYLILRQLLHCGARRNAQDVRREKGPRFARFLLMFHSFVEVLLVRFCFIFILAANFSWRGRLEKYGDRASGQQEDQNI